MPCVPRARAFGDLCAPREQNAAPAPNEGAQMKDAVAKWNGSMEFYFL
jgi:hypothetical protein